MGVKQVTLWVYANSDQEVAALQEELNKFVMEKYNNGIYIKANTLRGILQKYGNNSIVNAALKL